MSGTPSPKNSMGNTIKLYLFPAMVTILASLIWRDVSEMRADVKALLAQSNVDKTDIQNLKKDVQMLEQTVFNKKLTASLEEKEPLFRTIFFRHEDFYDIKKYIVKN